MKVRQVILAALTVGMTSLSPAVAMADTTGAPVTAQHGSLVALGDSISYGYNLGPNNLQPSTEAFPNLLAKLNQDTVQNLAVPGWTSGDLLAALQNNSSFQSAVKSAKVVTVDIGSNDLLGLASTDGLLTSLNPSLTAQQQSQFAAAIAQFAKNLPDIINRVHSLNPSAYIVLYNLYDPFDATLLPGLHNLAEKLIGQENQIISQTAATSHLTVANAYQAFNGRQAVFVRPLDVHPTVYGQDALATVGEAALASEEVQSFKTYLQSFHLWW
ncbi:SGNH/GDSL hydrolase family protein [Alicyclobacillus tolerans]|uniref:SGNH/GDSL hydrolase family protein n=1 Tax=Alicyclobacillus tolerans TaxID=90970 RepID=UPI001F2A76BB|nr:SGNH/GDSL hydrolase family protein [Alicyclobacillus tolerans]MCF8565171.1 SGNH/GDSL hydrolase family protein [Alicyclobacillus tolerans]